MPAAPAHPPLSTRQPAAAAAPRAAQQLPPSSLLRPRQLPPAPPPSAAARRSGCSGDFENGFVRSGVGSSGGERAGGGVPTVAAAALAQAHPRRPLRLAAAAAAGALCALQRGGRGRVAALRSVMQRQPPFLLRVSVPCKAKASNQLNCKGNLGYSFRKGEVGIWGTLDGWKHQIRQRGASQCERNRKRALSTHYTAATDRETHDTSHVTLPATRARLARWLM